MFDIFLIVGAMALGPLLMGFFEQWMLSDDGVRRLVTLPRPAFKAVPQSASKSDALRIRGWLSLRRPLIVVEGVCLAGLAITSLF